MNLMPAALIVLASASCVGAVFMSSAADRDPDGSAESSAATAATTLLRSVPEARRKELQLPFESHERSRWHYVPGDRAGIPLARLDASQRALVDPLLQSALSEHGFEKAKAIVAHEAILAQIEGNPRRDPLLYYTAVFGEPAPRAPWAWRFEGHHLSVNATHLDGETQVVAPLFMGANPARVPAGPKSGLRLLAAEEDLARALMRLLPAERRERAVLSERAFSDIVTRNDPSVQGVDLAGLAARDMISDERTKLRELLHVYAERMTPAAAKAQLDRIESAGFENLHFGWAGSIEAGQPHYYRIHGPTVLIEYDNTQNNANHIHTVWRDLQNDFGGDLLRAHYAQHARAGHDHDH